MEPVGQVLTVSVVVAAIVAFVVWLCLRRLVRGEHRDLVQRAVPSVTFVACAPLLFVLGSRSSYFDDGLCLICGERAPLVTLFGVRYGQSGPASDEGGRFRREFETIVGAHAHDWVGFRESELAWSWWFSDAVCVRDRASVAVWVKEMSTWPGEFRRQALQMYETWHPQHVVWIGLVDPDSMFTTWRNQCLIKHPEWINSAR